MAVAGQRVAVAAAVAAKAEWVAAKAVRAERAPMAEVRERPVRWEEREAALAKERRGARTVCRWRRR